MYDKEYYESHKEQIKASVKAWQESNKEHYKEYLKQYYQEHKDKINEARKEYAIVYRQAHKEEMKEYYQAHKEHYKANAKAWYEVHKEEAIAYTKAYKKSDLNANGETKDSIRKKSWRYLKKYGTKIPGYQIHHCCTYTEPYKFIYCSKEMHLMIHAYLRQHNISADSDHYEQIKHLLDDSVVLYGIE